jgi:MOSC domain-containing protein YiiM
MTHATKGELESGLDHVRAAPKDVGVLSMIVRRPAVGARDILDEGELNALEGLAGDSWRHRHGAEPDPDTQLNIMCVRSIEVIARDRSRWALAGDQLFVDFDLSKENLPAGSRLTIGSAVVEVSEEPHTGCAKFVARFGVDAQKFVNSPIGRALNLRGINARVVQSGIIRVGDPVTKSAGR